MATSNSTNYSLNGTELITSAFEMIGVAKGGEDLAPEDASTALRVLNVMLKSVQAELHIWKRKEATITLVAAQVKYTIGQKSAGNATSLSANNMVDSGANFNTDNVQAGDTVKNTTAGTTTTVSAVTSTTELALSDDIFTVGTEAYEITSADVSAPRPLRILDASRKDSSGNEINLTKISRNEYENLPNKTSTGTPISYLYEPTLNNGSFYIWLAPDATTVSTYTIELIYHAPIEDIDSLSDDLDLPAENLEALITGLAYRLSWRFGGLTPSERAYLKADAKDAMDAAVGFDQEDSSIYLQPELRV